MCPFHFKMLITVLFLILCFLLLFICRAWVEIYKKCSFLNTLSLGTWNQCQEWVRKLSFPHCIKEMIIFWPIAAYKKQISLLSKNACFCLYIHIDPKTENEGFYTRVKMTYLSFRRVSDQSLKSNSAGLWADVFKNIKKK